VNPYVGMNSYKGASTTSPPNIGAIGASTKGTGEEWIPGTSLFWSMHIRQHCQVAIPQTTRARGVDRFRISDRDTVGARVNVVQRPMHRFSMPADRVVQTEYIRVTRERGMAVEQGEDIAGSRRICGRGEHHVQIGSLQSGHVECNGGCGRAGSKISASDIGHFKVGRNANLPHRTEAILQLLRHRIVGIVCQCRSSHRKRLKAKGRIQRDV
jgi:hypothetical protein